MIAELRTFIVAARLGSFAATAERIGLTQSAISAQIRRLELELGYALFERTGRSVSLSKSGQTALIRAEEILTQFERMREIPGETSLHGTLRVGAISTSHTTILSPAIATLRDEFPSLRLHIVPDISISLLNRLDAGELEAAIMVRPPFGLMPHLVWTPLLTQKYVLIVPDGISGDDWRQLLATHPFIRYDSRSFGGRTVDRFLKANGLVTHDAVETEELNAILQMVSCGMGIAIVPSIPSLGATPHIRTVSLGERGVSREVGVMTLDTHQGRAIEALCTHLKAASAAYDSAYGFPQE